ncbi:hypothetical protein N0V90_001128 [Kalmusia sp. IMI 367209]|nr:hypothetical protein N0V90_001128 [Kalmusia sp. IMI 367209]
MTAREVYRYVDKRGDTIMFKFDPALIDDPTDGPLSVFHIWRHETRNTIQWSSMLLDNLSKSERYATDKKPMVGLLLWQGEFGGRHVVARWVGFEQDQKGFVIETPRRFV